MKDKFIILTTVENSPIIIGISNIGLIEPNNENSNTIVMLNYSRGKDFYPKTIHVKESFEQIKSMIGI